MPPSGASPWHGLSVGDVVELEDGRRGVIVGFYRREPETALIALEKEGQIEVPVDALRRD